MQTLRELRGSDPNLTLALARQGEARYPSSSLSAERSWFIVKALSELGLHEEARAAATALLRDHPQSRFAEDVHRHLFTNPPTHPSERGYGKRLELE